MLPSAITPARSARAPARLAFVAQGASGGRKVDVFFQKAPLVVFGLLSLAYWAGGRADSSEVVSNVRLAGLDVGGMKRTEAQKAVERLAEALPTTPITIVTPEFKLTTTARGIARFIKSEIRVINKA